MNNKVIFGRPKIRFGNVWAFTSRMVLYGIENNLNEVYLSSRSRKVDKIKEMWGCFDTNNIELKIVDEEITTGSRYGVPEHNGPYAKTKKQWKEGKYKKICYQLKTDSKKKEKAFKGDIDNFIKRIDDLGIETFSLGLPLSISDNIKIASECDMFIGICSGMTHVCYSVGIPVYIQNWKKLKHYHPGKKYITFENEENIFKIIRKKYGDV